MHSKDFDWRILTLVLALALLTCVIAAVMEIRRRRAAAHRRRINRFTQAGEAARQERLTRSAEQLAAGSAPVPAAPPAAWRGQRGHYERQTPRAPASVRFTDADPPELDPATAERFRTISDIVDPRLQPPEDPPAVDLQDINDMLARYSAGQEPRFEGQDGAFGGAGATGSYDPAPAAPVPAPPPEPPPAPAAACESHAAPTESPSYSYDPGPSSCGGDTSGGGGGGFES